MPEKKTPGDVAHGLDSIGDSERGILGSTHPELFVIFLPDEDSPRVERELAAAGMLVRATARNYLAQHMSDFVAIVKCPDQARLKSIVMGPRHSG